MSIETTNYAFKKPETTDDINITIGSDMPYNFDKIDNKFKDIDNLNESNHINAKFPPPPYVGLKGDGTTDDSSALQNLINLDKPLYVPRGIYVISKSIFLKENNLIGESAHNTAFDFDTPNHGFVIEPDTFTHRASVTISNFKVVSRNNSVPNHYAFYCGGAVEGTTPAYNFGINIDSIEIEKFGGGFYFSDIARLNVTRIGMTGVANPIYIKGSVVQSTFDTITNNGDNAPVTTLPSCGIYMDKKSTNDTGGYSVPESVKFNNCSFTKLNTGVAFYAGLFCSFKNMDLDFCQDTGIIFGSEGVFENVYIASQNQTSKFVGVHFKVNDLTKPNSKILKDVIITSYKQLQGDSVAIVYGDGGDTSTSLEEWGGLLERVRILGIADSWKWGIMADSNKSVTIRDCNIKQGSCINQEIYLANSKFAIVEGNFVKGGTIHVEAPISTSFGKIQFNQATVTQANMGSSNWVIDHNFAV